MDGHPITEGDLKQFLKAHPHVKVVGDFKAMGGKTETTKAVHVTKEYPAGYIPHEDEEQEELCRWLDNEHPEIKYFSVPNGARTSWSTANKLKATGLKAGVPDLVFPNPRAYFHGYYLELKRIKKGKVSDAQFIWIDFLRVKGYCVDVCKGAEEAKAGILAYHALGPFDGKVRP